jgi:hypothetical protein
MKFNDSGIAEFLTDAAVVTIAVAFGDGSGEVYAKVPVIRANSYGIAIEYKGKEVVFNADCVKSFAIDEYKDPNRITSAQMNYGKSLEIKLYGQPVSDWENMSKADAHSLIGDLVKEKEEFDKKPSPLEGLI